MPEKIPELTDEQRERIWQAYHHATRLLYDAEDELNYIIGYIGADRPSSESVLVSLYELTVHIMDLEVFMQRHYPVK